MTNDEITLSGFQLIYGKLNIPQVGNDSEFIAATEVDAKYSDFVMSLAGQYRTPNPPLAGGGSMGTQVDTGEFGDGIIVTRARKDKRSGLVVARSVQAVDTIGRPYFATRVIVLPIGEMEKIDNHLAWFLTKDRVSRPEDYATKTVLDPYRQSFSPNEINSAAQRRLLEQVIRQPSDSIIYFEVLKLLYRTQTKPLCFINYDPTQIASICLALSFGLTFKRRLNLSALTTYARGCRTDVRLLFSKPPIEAVPDNALVVNWNGARMPDYEDTNPSRELKFIDQKIQELSESFEKDKNVQRILDFPNELQKQWEAHSVENPLQDQDFDTNQDDTTPSPDENPLEVTSDVERPSVNLQQLSAADETLLTGQPQGFTDHFDPYSSFLVGTPAKPPQKNMPISPELPMASNTFEDMEDTHNRLSMPDSQADASLRRIDSQPVRNRLSLDDNSSSFADLQANLGNSNENPHAYAAIGARDWVDYLQRFSLHSNPDQEALLAIWEGCYNARFYAKNGALFWNEHDKGSDETWAKFVVTLFDKSPEICLSLLKKELGRGSFISKRVCVFAHAFKNQERNDTVSSAYATVYNALVEGHQTVLYPFLLYLFSKLDEYTQGEYLKEEANPASDARAEALAKALLSAQRRTGVNDALIQANLLMTWLYMIAYHQLLRKSFPANDVISSRVPRYWNIRDIDHQTAISALISAQADKSHYFAELKQMLYGIDPEGRGGEFPLHSIQIDRLLESTRSILEHDEYQSS